MPATRNGYSHPWYDQYSSGSLQSFASRKTAQQMSHGHRKLKASLVSKPTGSQRGRTGIKTNAAARTHLPTGAPFRLSETSSWENGTAGRSAFITVEEQVRLRNDTCRQTRARLTGLAVMLVLYADGQDDREGGAPDRSGGAGASEGEGGNSRRGRRQWVYNKRWWGRGEPSAGGHSGTRRGRPLSLHPLPPSTMTHVPLVPD